MSIPMVIHYLKSNLPRTSVARWLTFFELFQKGFIIPVHYDISDMDGQLIATFTIKNNVKRDELTLRTT